MVLWHLGATVAIARYAFRDERMDLRFLMLGAVLPDIIDTPIGLLTFSSVESVRLAGHTLLGAAAVMVAVVVSTRRGRPRKRWMPLAIGLLIHLFLDAMWADPETLWWPFLGLEWSSTGLGDAGSYVGDVLTNPWMWAGEALGAGYLGVLGRRGRLATTEARWRFAREGTIDVPIN